MAYNPAIFFVASLLRLHFLPLGKEGPRKHPVDRPPNWSPHRVARLRSQRAAPVTTKEEKWWKKKRTISLPVLRGHVRLVVADLATTGPCRGGHHSTRNAPAERCDCAGDHSGYLRTRSRSVLLSAGIARQRCRSPVPARPAGSSFWLVCVACAPAGAWRNRLARVGTAGAMGRAAPEDAPAFRMGLPTVSTGDDLPRRRTGRTGLARIHPGPAGGATGTLAGQPGARGDLGRVAHRRCSSYREPARASCRSPGSRSL